MKKYFLNPLQNLAVIAIGLYDNVVGNFMDDKRPKDEAVITPEHREVFAVALGRHEKHVKYLALKQSLKYIAVMYEKLKATDDYSYQDYQDDIDILQTREEHEMEDIVFGFIPADHASYFQNKELFRPEVNANFKSTVKDIYEAGNCFAHGNYTASVFHLMRVLEIALHVLAKALNVTFPAAIEIENWQNIIEKIESEIARLEKTLPKGTQKSEDLQFYSEAAKEFRYFKNAWRNHVSHSREDYEIQQCDQDHGARSRLLCSTWRPVYMNRSRFILVFRGGEPQSR